MVEKPVLYVVVNKSLGMSPGKVAAQVGHAVAGSMSISGIDQRISWNDAPHRWLIVLEASDGVQLYSTLRYLSERDVASYLVVDEGVNEIPPMSATALGVEILDKDSAEAAYLSDLPLFSQNADFEKAFERGRESRKWRYRVGFPFYTCGPTLHFGDAKEWLKGILPWY